MAKKERGKKDRKLSDKVSFAESVGKRQLRIRDWIAEKTIKIMAFGSIAFVALIFIFVFRETLPLFNDPKNGQNNSAEAGAGKEPEVHPKFMHPKYIHLTVICLQGFPLM
jgi:hypothetical protein